MANQREVVATVKSQKGHCALEHSEGQQFQLSGKTPAGICSWAYQAMFPAISVLQYGGSFPWESDPDCTTIACPDAANPVVFELRRVPAE